MADEYFYQPASGHGLKHNPFNAIVGPRPIGWVSTQGEDGMVNLAPYSFFNAFSYTPPIVGFASTAEKDSLRNVRETGEFVWNLATRPQAEAMNLTSIMADYGLDEFDYAGLTKAPSRLVAPPRVAGAPVTFECKVSDIMQLRSHTGALAESWLTIGEVVGVHIDRAFLKNGVFDTFGAGIILRAGGPGDYLEVRPDAAFKMRRSK